MRNAWEITYGAIGEAYDNGGEDEIDSGVEPSLVMNRKIIGEPNV